MKWNCKFILGFGLVLFFFSECTVRYPTSDNLVAPVLSDLILTDTLYLQSNIGYSISVRASDPQGWYDIQNVNYSIYPLNDYISIYQDTLQDDGNGGDIIPRDGLFFGNLMVNFVEGHVGQYCVEVIAYDLFHHASNVLFDTLTVVDDQKNLPPVLSCPVTPDTLTVDLLRDAFFTIQAADPQGNADIDSVFFQIYPLLNLNPSFRESLRDDGLNGDELADDGVYSFLGDLSDTLKTIGEHLIRYQAIDGGGLFSRPVVSSFYVNRPNGPPILSQLSMPDTVSRSAGLSFLISIRVDDPQGLADVKKVYFNMTKPDDMPYENNPVPLFDDGNYGDLDAGDGQFSLSATMSTQTDKGIYRFDFFAEDYSGAISDSLTHQLTVVD